MNWLRKFHVHQILISLLIGFVLGVSYERVIPHQRCGPPPSPNEMKEHMIKKLSKDLRLNKDQKVKVRAIFDEKQPQMMALHKQMRPQFEALRNSTNEEIGKILNPDQQKRFDKLNEEMKERFKKFQQ